MTIPGSDRGVEPAVQPAAVEPPPPLAVSKPPVSKSTIAVCVLAGALGLGVAVHAIASGLRQIQEDERVEVLDVEDRSEAELEAERLLNETERLETEKAQLRRECI